MLVTGSGPYYAPLAEIDFEKARRSLDAHLFLPLHVARNAADKICPGGALLLIGGTGGRRPTAGALITASTAALPARTRARTRTRARPRQPHRARLRRHAAIGDAARRPTRRTTRTTPHDVADRPRRRPRRRCRPRRSPHDEHRADGRYLRHRRRPATGRDLAGADVPATRAVH